MIVLRKVRPTSGIIVLSGSLLGNRDNSNKVFTTESNYKTGNIKIEYNGQSLSLTDDFTETGVNEVTLIHIAPHYSDVLRATYEVDS